MNSKTSAICLDLKNRGVSDSVIACYNNLIGFMNSNKRVSLRAKNQNCIVHQIKNWSELTTFFEYPQEIRKIINITNAVGSNHTMVRKFTKSKAVFSTDDSIRTVIYMSVSEISKKWIMPVRDLTLAYLGL